MFNQLTGFAVGTELSTTNIILILILYLVFILAIVGAYIYFSLALMTIAKKTNTKDPWLAWIPIGNMILLSRIAKMHWWPILLMIPAMISLVIGVIAMTMGAIVTGMISVTIYFIVIIILSVYSTIWTWKMFKSVNRPGWWSLITIIFMPIYIIFSIAQMAIAAMITAILTMITYLVFLGIAAWGNKSVENTKSIKPTIIKKKLTKKK